MSKMLQRVLRPDEYRTEKMMTTIMTMKMSKKQLEKQGKKLETAADKLKVKVKKAMEDKDYETAKLHAENCVRNKTTAKSFYQMAGRVDAVTSRMREALATKTLSKNMEKVVNGMSSALATMQPETMAVNMAKFEELSDNLGVTTDFFDLTISGATKTGMADGEVQELLDLTADEVGQLKLSGFDELAGLPVPLEEKERLKQREAAKAEEQM